MTFSPERNELYAVGNTGETGYVSVFSSVTGQRLRSISLGEGNMALSVAVERFDNILWVANWRHPGSDHDQLLMLDLNSLEVVADYDVGPDPYGMFVDPVTDDVWIGSMWDGRIQVHPF